MITAISSPDRFGSLLRGQLKKSVPTMIYLAVVGFLGIPLPYLLVMFCFLSSMVSPVVSQLTGWS